MMNETVTGDVTESEIVTDKILLVGKVREHLGDTESAHGVRKGTRNAQGHGNGKEITGTDTANMVSIPLNHTPLIHHPSDYFSMFR